jgi:hypothetical protein
MKDLAKRRAYDRRWRKNNRQKCQKYNAGQRRWRKKNRQKINARRLRWAKENPLKVKAARQRSYQKNKAYYQLRDARRAKNLSDGYIGCSLFKTSIKNFPPELIALKRKEIQLTRLLSQKTQP